MFKKWQYSNMKLLIEGSLIYKNEDFVNKIKTYKYRDDVLLLGSLSKTQIATITASAYCVLYTPKASGFVSPIIAAMQSGVPIITMNNIGMQETGGNIPLYSNSNQPEDIAEQMQLIYKDENLRTNLMQKGVEQASKFSWEKTIENFWNVIEEAIK
jgi:glycosyltransferase involved in cell wall biosynthesis